MGQSKSALRLQIEALAPGEQCSLSAPKGEVKAFLDHVAMVMRRAEAGDRWYEKRRFADQVVVARIK